MFVAITNTPRDYAWGSRTAMAELLGNEATGGPEAELWLGAHPGSPSRIVSPEEVGGARDLAQWIESDPASALGPRRRLPFLMKVLAAGAPLSLQAHPSAQQASEGFDRENRLGVPLDAPHRNYRDAYPKPEVIYALSESFEALCGFRPVEESREVFLALGLEGLNSRLDDLPGLFAWLLSSGEQDGDGLGSLVPHAVARAESILSHTAVGDSLVVDAAATVQLLSRNFPGDIGIICALLLNRVTLSRGEALYLPAGNIHAYLSGAGIEVMTASDNVLRGGLTPKHVDVPELLTVVDVRPLPVPWLLPEVISQTLEVFRPGVEDFVLARITGAAEYRLSGPAIVLCTTGSFEVVGADGNATVSRGEAVYVTPGESPVAISGSGELFLATTP